jgi:hypothetical protein
MPCLKMAAVKHGMATKNDVKAQYHHHTDYISIQTKLKHGEISGDQVSLYAEIRNRNSPPISDFGHG